MKSAGCFVVLVVLIHALSAVAVAGDITIFGGFQDPGKLTLSDAGSTVAALTRPGTFGVFGVRYSGSGGVASEQTIAFAPNFIDSHSKAFILNSNVLLQAPAPVVRPYVTAGLGTVMTFGEGISDIGTKFAVNYGLGVKVVRALGPIGARLDYRRYIIPGVQSQTLKATEVSFGIVFSN